MIRGCRACCFLAECGGLDGTLDFFGCHRASPEVCRANGWTCPQCSPGEFLRRKAAVRARVRGAAARPNGPLVPLPAYVGNLQHRYRWTGRLAQSVVAIPTPEVIGGRGRSFGPKFKTLDELRRKFHLGPDTQVLLVSVTTDPFLEQYWRWAKETRAVERLAELGVAGITVPNFSFFSDAPRFHHLYNRGRLEACLNELAAAAVPVIPHIHALTAGDLEYWRAWLREHVEVRHVCREFQTGNDEEAINEIARLQDEIGRALHPVIVGGARFAARLRDLFTHSTIVDSTPFMKGVHRQRAVECDGRVAWESHPTRTARAAGALVRHNIELYGAIVGNPSRYQTSMLDAFEQALLEREAARVSKQTALPLKPGRAVRLPVLLEPGAVRKMPEEPVR
jgi:Domain of unknown function (DUF4417)